MKTIMKPIKLTFSLILIFLSFFSKADVQFGTGEGKSHECPLYSFYKNSFMQCVYEKEKLGPGTITEIQLFNTGGHPFTYKNVNIYISETDLLDSPGHRINNGFHVYSGDLVIDNNSGWKKIQLHTPYEYSHNRNLIVLIQHETGASLESPAVWKTHKADGISVYEYTDDPLNGKQEFTHYRMDIRLVGINPAIPGTLSGQVLNSAGEEISEAKVSILNKTSCLTEIDGTFSLSNLVAGKYTIITQKNGYIADRKENIEIIAGETTNLEIVLLKPKPNISSNQIKIKLHPKQYQKRDISIKNTGDGSFSWEAYIEFVSEYENNTPTKEYYTSKLKQYTNPNKRKWDPKRTLPKIKAPFSMGKSEAINKYLRAQNIYGINLLKNTFGFFEETKMTEFHELESLESYRDHIFSAGDFLLNNDHTMFIVDCEGNLFSQFLEDDGARTEFLIHLDLGKEVDYISGLATDPTSGLLYLSSTTDLFIIDPYSFETTHIGPFSSNINYMLGICFNKEGQLFGVDYNDNLIRIEKSTAKTNIIGNTGFSVGGDVGLTYDAASDKILMSCFDHDTFFSELRMIDQYSGNSELIGQIPDNAYMYFICINYDAFPKLWLSLDSWKGNTLPFGKESHIGLNFDTKNLVPGQILKAKVHIKSKDLAHFDYVIPIILEVEDYDLPDMTVLNIEKNENNEGNIHLSWDIKDDSKVDYYKIYKNNSLEYSTSQKETNLQLDQHGIYSFMVSAVIDESMETSPEGPEYTSYFSASICKEKSIHNESIWKGSVGYTYDTIYNCGDGVLEFEISAEGNDNEPLFITDIVPKKGTIEPGCYQKIRYTYNAEGALLGNHFNAVNISSNSPEPKNNISIEHMMNVTDPCLVKGTIKDANTNIRLPGVKIIALNDNERFEASTDMMGDYYLQLNEGTYTLYFDKIGYQEKEISDQNVSPSNPIHIDLSLAESPFSPGNLNAKVNMFEPKDTECKITWSLPYGKYQLMYDGNYPNNYLIGGGMGNAFAVKFTPKGYPATITGAQIYIGDGSYPENNNYLGERMLVSLRKSNEEGLPGELIDEKLIVSKNYEWLKLSGLFNSVIEEGSFFIIYTQIGSPIRSAPIGVDTKSPPAYKSFVFNKEKKIWEISALQNIMIRAELHGPNNNNIIDSQTVVTPARLCPEYKCASPEKLSPGIPRKAESVFSDKYSRDVVSYELARIKISDPNIPLENIEHTLLENNLTQLLYIDAEFKNLDASYYAYKIRAHYSNNDTSEWQYSNVVGHNIHANLTVNVSLSTEKSPIGATLLFTNTEYPYNTYSIDVQNENGILELPKDMEDDWFYKGSYILKAHKPAYQDYIHPEAVNITEENHEISITIQERIYSVNKLKVNPITSIANWEKPRLCELNEFFDEQTEDLPAGWTSSSMGNGWKYGTSYSSDWWSIPEYNTQFIAVNDDKGGVFNDASNDVLYTPSVDLRESKDFKLCFYSYFDGLYGAQASVIYSIDNGKTWNLFKNLKPDSKGWIHHIYSLEELAGNKDVKHVNFGFVFSDQGLYSSGWALDSIRIGNGYSSPQSYNVLLDDKLVATTENLMHFFSELKYNTFYTAGIEVNYSSGTSKPVYHTFKSKFLCPPRDFAISNEESKITFKWKTPRLYKNEGFNGDIPDNLIGFNLYKDNSEEAFAFIEKNSEEEYILEKNMEAGNYIFQVAAVYNLDKYGLEDQTDISEKLGPIDFAHIYGLEIPLFEDWSSSSFLNNKWTVSDHWEIDIESGNEKPSVSYIFTENQEETSNQLVSSPLNTKLQEIGSFHLDFDLNLSKSASSEDKIKVEIGIKDQWNTIGTYSAMEEYNWKSIELDISQWAAGNIFKIRFSVENSSEPSIKKWQLDNISIYRSCNPIPFDLNAKITANNDESPNGIALNWKYPFIPKVNSWIHYDNDENNEGCGNGKEGILGAAIKLSEQMAEDNENLRIDKVKFYLNSDVKSFILKIWKGKEMSEEIFSQNVSAENLNINDWTVLDITEEIIIEKSKEYYIGYIVKVDQDNLPLGASLANHVPGHSDLISNDGKVFSALSDLSKGNLKYSWNIQAHITSENMKLSKPSEDENKLKFHVYRSCDQDDFMLIKTTKDKNYLDPESNPENNLSHGKYYEYYVTAQRNTEKDECLTEASNIIGLSWYVKLNEIDENRIQIGPNPTKTFVYVKSDLIINKIQLNDQTGRPIMSKDINAQSFDINFSHLSPGVYIIMFEANHKVFFKKITIL
ncbi:MAG: carboxypeptidase regulatory-like domain-containing protein [Bacteroidales bacterium]